MATKSQEILLKGNTTNASAVPSSLKVREIAINALDRSLFTNDGNSIVKLYTGTTKWFDVNGNANNALKLGGILASEYINKEAFNSHINNSTIHITAAERTAWNNKWDYNEDTIKGVKVNAAVLSDSATKLQTPHTLWGKPFDGTSDVSGNIHLGNGSDYEIGTGFDNSNTTRYNKIVFGAAYTGLQYISGLYTLDNVIVHRFIVNGGNFSTTALAIMNNANVLIGTTTDNGYKLDVNGTGHYSGDLICGGEVAAIVGEGTPAGVTDYSALTGKPSINGVTLVSGNNTLAALGIQAAGDYATNSGVTTLLADYATKTFVANNYAGKAAFNSHTADADIHITAEERVAWNAKWDYNEATIKAVKVNSASSADSVAWSGIKDKPTTFAPSAHTHTASEINGLPTKLSAFNNDVGYITGITKSMVEGVLTGDITSHTHSYLPLSGGILTGSITIQGMNAEFIRNITHYATTHWESSLISLNVDNVNKFNISAFGLYTLGATDNGIIYAYLGMGSYNGTNLRIYGTGTNDIKWGDNNILHAGNFTKSLVEGVLTGDITSHTHSYLPLSGGTITGTLMLGNPNVLYNGANTTIFRNASSTADYGTHIVNNWNGGSTRILLDSNGVYYRDTNGNKYPLIHSGNYNSYSPTLTGTGASGTWGINISGNAATATKLQDNTAFTAWGQTFFENGKPKNVSGDLNVGISKIYWLNDANKYSIGIGNDGHAYYKAYYGHHFYAIGVEILTIVYNGNILIGTTTDNGYKLDVNGTGHYSGDLIVDGEVSALVA